MNMTVPLGALKVPLFDHDPVMVKFPTGAVTDPFVIVNAVDASAGLEKLHAPPTPLKIIFANLLVPVNVPEMVLPVVVELKVTVPLLDVNVPLLFVQLPPRIIV